MSGVNQAPPPRGYRERKLYDPPICARAGCALPPADDSDLCAVHRDYARERSREAHKRKRRTNRRRRLCAYCPAPSKTYACAACTVRLKRTPRAVNNTVNNTVADRTRTGADGRTRYHGQERRGRQSNADLSEQDLAEASAEIERAGIDFASTLKQAKRDLAFAHGPSVSELPAAQRRAVLVAALARVDLARRILEELLERYRYDALAARGRG